MRTSMQRWGNSLALRIPKVFAEEIGMAEGTPIELLLIDDHLVIQRAVTEPLGLEDLLRGVTEANLHGEWDTGPAVGGEVW